MTMHNLADMRYCRRCTSERHLIKFMTPDSLPYYLCGPCVEEDDKRKMRFSPSWKRTRRPTVASKASAS